MRLAAIFLLAASASAQYTQNWNQPHPPAASPDFANGAFIAPIQPNQLGITFTIPAAVNGVPVKSTSAIIRNAAGKEIRTLWQGRGYSAGVHGEIWDGRDDYGVVASGGPFTAVVEYNAVVYTWDGVLGDTNPNLLAPNSWDGPIFGFPADMASIGGKGFTAAGYNEGNFSGETFPLATPSVNVDPFPQQTINQNLFYRVTTDGKLVYFAQDNPGNQNRFGGVVAFDANGYLHNFSAGGPVITPGEYSNFADKDNQRSLSVQLADYMPTTATDAITGVAVQRNGNILAVGHGKLSAAASADSIHLVNKVTGASLGNIAFPNPQRMTFDLAGNLWVISNGTLYQVAGVGSTNTITIPIAGLLNPVSLAVSPVTGHLFVADGGTHQQVFEYASGVLVNTLGVAGGYGLGNSCNAAVSPYKFWFDFGGFDMTTQVDTYAPNTPFLNVDDNGDLEVDDISTGQVLFYHLTAGAWTYNRRIMYQAGWRTIAASLADPTRIFIGQGSLLEIKRDWSKPLQPGEPSNGAWALVNNWAPCIMSAVGYQGTGMMFARDVWKSPTNGNTYMMLSNLANVPAWAILNPNGSATLEVVPNQPLYGWTRLALNGDQPTSENNGSIPFLHITGYDAAGMPITGGQTTFATVAVNHANGDPRGDISSEVTADGTVVVFEGGKNKEATGPAFHLGGVKAGSTTFDWRAYPEKNIAWADGNGYFPKANLDNVASEGVEIHAAGNDVFTMFAGNYSPWACQWMHYRSDGVFVGQFGYLTQFSGTPNGMNGYGVNGVSSFVTGEPKVPGFCGDVGTFKVLQVGKNLKILAPDESYFHGVHEWDISNLDSITELTGSGTLGSTITLQ